MKNFYTICMLLASAFVFAQEAGKAGELLKNEAKGTDKKMSENTRHSNTGTSNSNNREKPQTGRRTPINNSDYRWNYNYGNAEVFLRIPEQGRFTVEVGDQMMSNSTGKFRFYDLRAGGTPISIYDNNFLIYRTTLMLKNNTRVVLDFFSDHGLYSLGNYPQNNQSNGFNEWDDIWNTGYQNPNSNFNGNYNGYQNNYANVMNNQEFANLVKEVKREANFDDNKSRMIVSVAQHVNFSSNQTYQLVKLLNYESNKLQLAKQLFGQCVDKQNFYQVYKAFNFESSKRELSEYISK